ncbi:Apextrin-like protein [Plakobranchus ocellatus]|uniref:Apextrin-like protein n=1 Tax=Plakobranchus ocellatus TaxID=259542 RepID=A0AAV4DFD3_9GAST|nr:Apextrin-like protein [Plakobranchus ocellatus]
MCKEFYHKLCETTTIVSSKTLHTSAANEEKPAFPEAESTHSQWSARFTVVLVLSLSHPSQAFLSDDETLVSLTPFDLTYTPAHVVRHVTRDVILLCAHQTDDQMQPEEVSRIRILMKTSSGWDLLAEQRDKAAVYIIMISASGRITKDIKVTFLQITWPVAREDTFGSLERTDLNSIVKDINELKSFKDLFENLITWAERQFAFLKPKTGCPVDLAFFGGTEKYYRIHTLSRDEYKNVSRHILSLNPGTIFRDDSENFLTLRFCEASGIFITKPWPSGSYCVNKVDSTSCPRGLGETSVRLDAHHTKVVHDIFDFLLKVEDHLEFCCTHSGFAATPIVMPRQSPFMLYRTRGRCQEVAGMDAVPVAMNIDTDDIIYVIQDDADGLDMDIQDGFPTKIHLCHYEKA